MGNKLLKSNKKNKSFETPITNTITAHINIPKKNKTITNTTVEQRQKLQLPIQLANAQRNFINQTGQIPDKVGILDYSDMVVQKLPFWGNRWKRGFFTLCKTTLYTMSMKGKTPASWATSACSNISMTSTAFFLTNLWFMASSATLMA